MAASLPVTDHERRVALAYLASLAASPVEGHDDPEDWDPDDVLGESRPALVLRLTPVSQDWATVSGSLAVRRALRRTGSTRTLGARGFLRTVRDISTGTRADNQSRRRARLAEVERERRAHADELRGYDPGDLPNRFRLSGADRTILSDRTPDNECPVSHRQNSSTELVRLRRDFGLDTEPWERLLARYTDDAPCVEDLLADAAALGFDCTSPIPAAWVQRVEVEDWDEDDEGDDEDEDRADEPEPTSAPRALAERPTFTAPSLPPMTDPHPSFVRRLFRTPAQPEPLVLTPEQASDLKQARIEERQEQDRRKQWACGRCGEVHRRYRSTFRPSDLVRCPDCNWSNDWRRAYPQG
jgi:hypothetical protein